MKEHNGIGDFAEDHLEQGHQFGMQEERRTHGLRDRGKAANSHSKWETMRLHPLVEKVTSEMIKGTKRRRLLVDGDGRTPKMARDENRRVETENLRVALRDENRAAPAVLIPSDEHAKLDYRAATNL
jgi:hypothetical protein